MSSVSGSGGSHPQIQKLQELTQELDILSSEIQSSTYSGREYQTTINDKLRAHAEIIQTIFSQCIGQPDLSAHLDNYATRINAIHTLLPPLESTVDKVTNATHLILYLNIQPKLNQARVINKISIAFGLNEGEIRASMDPSKPFFPEAANVCCRLANQRLVQGGPLGFKEVKAIHEAFSDPSIQGYIPPKPIPIDCAQPHPAHVFESLHTFLASVENFESGAQIQEGVEKYLTGKPSKERLETFLNLPAIQQKSVLETIKKGAAEGDSDSKSFLESLEKYQTQLSSFKEGLKQLPIVNAKVILEGSLNVNQTFFLNINGKTGWIFKPASENGMAIVQAECTASRLNQDGKFPIPLTIPLLIKGELGSAQMYVEDARTLAEVEIEVRAGRINIDTASLQKLAIFDLLFANSDRNSANFLFQNSDGLAKIVGIDHDSCLMYKEIRSLKFEYLDLPALQQPLQEGMAVLFSEEAVQKYKQIMAQNGVSGYQLQSQQQWIDIVAEQLNKALEDETPLLGVIEELQNLYEENFLS